MAGRLGLALLLALVPGPAHGSFSTVARRVNYTRPVAKVQPAEDDDSDWANEATQVPNGDDGDDVPGRHGDDDEDEEAEVVAEAEAEDPGASAEADVAAVDHVDIVDKVVSDDSGDEDILHSGSAEDLAKSYQDDVDVESSIPDWEQESTKARIARNVGHANAVVQHIVKAGKFGEATDHYLRNPDGKVHQFYSCSMACNGCYTENYQGCLAYCQKGCEAYCEVQLPRPQCEQGQIWVAKVGSIIAALDKNAVLCQATGVDNCPDGLANEQLPPNTNRPGQ